MGTSVEFNLPHAICAHHVSIVADAANPHPKGSRVPGNQETNLSNHEFMRIARSALRHQKTHLRPFQPLRPPAPRRGTPHPSSSRSSPLYPSHSFALVNRQNREPRALVCPPSLVAD